MSPMPLAKKRLGQHFLRDNHLIAKIVRALELQPGDKVLEIGPGPATLTRPLLQAGVDLTVVEYDPEMTAYLRDMPECAGLHIVEGDFLKLDLDPLLTPGTKVISNLPYNISVPITARLLRYAPKIPLMVLMYQKEVAERLRAKPSTKDYGIASVLTQLFFDFDFHFNVGPSAFVPPPKVTSQVLRFRPLVPPKLRPDELDSLEQLLGLVFGQRRKMLGGTIRRGRLDWCNSTALLQSLESLGIPLTHRPEQLGPEQFAAWLRHAKELHGSD